MFLALLNVLTAGLTLWNNKEKTKYMDKIIKLKEAYRVEINRPFEERNNLALDNLEWELRLLGTAFAASVGSKEA